MNFDYPMFIWIFWKKCWKKYNTFWYEIVYVETYTEGKMASTTYFYSSQWSWKKILESESNNQTTVEINNFLLK